MYQLSKEKITRNLQKSKLANAMMALLAAAMTGNKTHADTVMRIEATKLTKNAFLGVVVMSVMSLVVGSVFLYIGIFVNTTVYNAIPVPTTNTTADLEFNATMLGVKTNVNTAFTLGGIIMIIIGAAGIITVLLGMVPKNTR